MTRPTKAGVATFGAIPTLTTTTDDCVPSGPTVAEKLPRVKVGLR